MKREKEYNFIPCIEVRISDSMPVDVNISFHCSEEVARQFICESGSFKRLVDVAQERFILLCLNAKNSLINYSIIAQGSLTSALVHPREVLKAAILSNAASVIFVHNHPSGDPEPSNDDIEITDRLCKSFDTCGIKVLDHIIVAKSGYYSFKLHQLI